MAFFTYMLECADQSIYTGSTKDLSKRLHQHNHLKSGAHYTKIRRPVKLVYSETCNSLNEARSREYYLKKLTRLQKLFLIKKFTKNKKTLPAGNN